MFWHLLIALLVMTALRALYYGYNNHIFPAVSSSELFRIFIGGARFDIAVLFYALIIYILLVIIGGYLPSKIENSRYYNFAKNFSYLAPMIVIIFLSVSDTGYYPYVLRRVNKDAFTEFKTVDLGGMYATFISDFWDLTLAFFILVTILIFGYFVVKFEYKRISSLRIYSIGNIIIALFIFWGMRGMVAFDARPLNDSIVSSSTDNYFLAPLVFNTPYSILQSSESKYDLKEFYPQERLSDYFIPYYEASALSDNDSLFGAFKGSNVMVILMESMGKEYIGGLNKEIEDFESYTPFLDSLLSKSLYAQFGLANGKRSVEAFPPTFAALPTFGGTFNDVECTMDSYQHFDTVTSGLPASLKSTGYSTIFYHGDLPDAFGLFPMLKKLGVEKQFTRIEHGNDNDLNQIDVLFDAPFLESVASDMNQLEEPFLSIFFSLTNHYPYDIPKHLTGRYKKGKLPIHTTAQYADESLKLFFEQIEESDWYENTLFVLVADHTNLSDRPEYDNVAGHCAIPIIFFDPKGRLSGAITDRVVSQADITPTLLYLLGNQTPILSYGSNIFDQNAEHMCLNFLSEHYHLFNKRMTLVMNTRDEIKVLPPTPRMQISVKEQYEDLTQEEIDHYSALLKAIVQDYNYRVKKGSFTLSAKEIAKAREKSTPSHGSEVGFQR